MWRLLVLSVVMTTQLHYCKAERSRVAFVSSFFQQSLDRQYHTKHLDKNFPVFHFPLEAPKRQLSFLKSTKDAASSKEVVWTSEELDAFALSEGVELTKSTLGPGFRIVVRSTHNASKILGYGEGFVRPAGDILHLDKMEVFQPIVQQVKKENPNFRNGGTTFGVGLIFGYECLLHGLEAGCTEAEFLAIDDEDYQHRRLVRYYKNSGFKIIKYIGDDFQDIPARMVWGGCGTLMRAKIADLMPLWSQLFIDAAERRKNQK